MEVSPVVCQHVQGKINVTVLDEQGAVVPGARLELTDLATNDTRAAETSEAGTYSFVNLNAGRYKLTVTHAGFQVLSVEVTVETARTSDVRAELKVGVQTQTIEVAAVAPLVETTTNAIGSTVDLRHIENLPLGGRNVERFYELSPGYTGTFNGLPTMALSSNIDGVQQGPTRMKYGGMPRSVFARIDNIEEMTVQTDQMNLNQGFGQGAMQINYTTRRGSNDYHGTAYFDFRNDNLNANTWRNNMLGIKRAEYKRSEFGGNIGGPILRDKLFFFFAFGAMKQPQWSNRSSNFVISSAQGGDFSYVLASAQTTTLQPWMNCGTAYPAGFTGTVPAGTTCTADLFALATGYNSANGTSLPTSVNSVISGLLGRVNGAIADPSATTTTTTNPIVNTVLWQSQNPLTDWYPTLRVDYTPTQKIRMNMAYNQTKRVYPNNNAPYYPGQEFIDWVGGGKFDGFTGSYGLDWTLSPTLINAFKLGYLYNASFFGYNSSREFVNNPVNIFTPLMRTPQEIYRPVTSSYPVWSISDTMTWQRGAHTFNFGFSYYREFDNYWNPPEGISDINLGIVNGDPAINAFTTTNIQGATTAQQGDARSLYALLTGRISSIFGRYAYDPSTGDYKRDVSFYKLEELAKAWSLFFQDSWRWRPDLTINAGLRWDFTDNSVDLTGAYHNLDEAALWGPSGVGNLFAPGTLTGTTTPQFEARANAFNAWKMTPQPTLGIVWNPQYSDGILGRLMGQGDTVVRAGFSLRFFTVPYQYYWDNASAYGSFFYQFFNLAPGNPANTGEYTPGSLALGDPLPPYLFSPTAYAETALMSNVTTFRGGGPPATGFEYNIGQPYTMSWTLGIQRKFGPTRALEVRYNANRTLKQWIAIDLNEANIFESGLLNEFINAQANLAICRANQVACRTAAGSSSSTFASFANLGLAGQVNLPILTTAFTGSSSGVQTNSNFSSSSFITPLDTGAAGSMAHLLIRGSSSAAGGRYYCNLVGRTFAPCTTGPVAGTYPINFLLANPFAIRGTGDGYGSSLMTDGGYSNYHSLQVDFRQRLWNGVAFNANYTWSKTLGVATPDDWTAGYYAYTQRDLRFSYGPTRFDRRHVFNLSGTFDLPFGRGRKWMTQSPAVVDHTVGGWTIGVINTIRTGTPGRVTGGYSTFNNFADGGVNLIGLTAEQLQDNVGMWHEPGANYVTIINPALRTVGVGANTAYLQANTTPGVLAPVIWIYGNPGYELDLSVSKTFKVTERVRLDFQTQFLNAFNHPTFTGAPTGSVRSSGWGTQSGQSNGPRVIEMRLKVAF